MDVSEYTSKIAGEAADYNADQFFSKKDQRRMDLFTQYAIISSRDAVAASGIKDAGLDPGRVGVVYASGIGGLFILIDQMKVLMGYSLPSLTLSLCMLICI